MNGPTRSATKSIFTHTLCDQRRMQWVGTSIVRVCNGKSVKNCNVLCGSATFVPKMSQNDGMDVPDAIRRKCVPKAQILRHTDASLARLIVRPFRFTPRLNKSTNKEKSARASGNKRRKRRDESMAAAKRFFVPLSVFSLLLEQYTPRVCRNVFGVVIE